MDYTATASSWSGSSISSEAEASTTSGPIFICVKGLCVGCGSIGGILNILAGCGNFQSMHTPGPTPSDVPSGCGSDGSCLTSIVTQTPANTPVIPSMVPSISTLDYSLTPMTTAVYVLWHISLLMTRLTKICSDTPQTSSSFIGSPTSTISRPPTSIYPSPRFLTPVITNIDRSTVSSFYDGTSTSAPPPNLSIPTVSFRTLIPGTTSTVLDGQNPGRTGGGSMVASGVRISNMPNLYGYAFPAILGILACMHT